MVERTADQRIRTTEWEDIQYKHGNKVGRYREQELEILAQKIGDANPNVNLRAYNPEEERIRAKMERAGFDADPDEQVRRAQAEDLAGGDDEDDFFGDDDDDALAAFRAKRMNEIQKQAEKACFGRLIQISGTDYVKEITEASSSCWVIAVLMKLGHEECDALIEVFSKVARREREIKFVSVLAKEAIPNFPAKHLPCVLFYHNGAMVKQTTGMEPWTEDGKLATLTPQTVDAQLRRSGVLRSEDDDDEIADEADERIALRTGDAIRKK